tara:strand:+ start:284 stop:601 length:318 start_codon:yes stop_codon:yes gene_type:complete
MNNVIYVEFQKQSKRKLPRKRVFYLGQYYAGPPLCQSLEKLWLKRKPNNRWVFQQKIYGIVFEYEEYDGDNLLAALDNIPLVDEVTMDDLLEMGWRHQGEVIQYA